LGRTEWATGPDSEPFAASGACRSVRGPARIAAMPLHGEQGKPADRRARGLVEAAPCSGRQHRRVPPLRGYQWFVLDIAFSKPKRLGHRATGAHEDGRRRKRSAAIHHSRASASHSHYRRRLPEEDQLVFANKGFLAVFRVANNRVRTRLLGWHLASVIAARPHVRSWGV
jgi:hypothetical protein